MFAKKLKWKYLQGKKNDDDHDLRMLPRKEVTVR